ncbi:hypothetical protein NKG05_11295 [Oerskovia sp. M15]
MSPRTPGGPRFVPRDPPEPDVAQHVMRGVGSTAWRHRPRIRFLAPATEIAARVTDRGHPHRVRRRHVRPGDRLGLAARRRGLPRDDRHPVRGARPARAARPAAPPRRPLRRGARGPSGGTGAWPSADRG